MCSSARERAKLIGIVKELYRNKGERWMVVINRSGRLEMIPERNDLKELKVTLIYKNETK